MKCERIVEMSTTTRVEGTSEKKTNNNAGIAFIVFSTTLAHLGEQLKKFFLCPGAKIIIIKEGIIQQKIMTMLCSLFSSRF